MNKYCKDALYHAWTNVSPEQVSEYNKGYYAEHKNDWVIRKQKQMEKKKNPIFNHGASNNGVQSGTGEKFGIKDIANGAKKTYDFVKNTIETGKNFINRIIDWRKEVHKERGDTSSTFVSVIKSGFEWLKNYFKS